ncbi:enoyl-CoA hydratase-related protein [Vibrio mexicanus]|uniref:enoyl-CoA hydratase-related protein n=1 Tax=Vibrio mexicanus TaxID=1004326 RepID=UPI000B24E839|nr:enoyl-CoA hydratase-related protein [Vibrio mexicanus]
MSVAYQIDSNRCATITLDRPQTHNAFDDVIIQMLIDAINQAHSDNARALILNSNGKHFSAGADLTWMKSMVNNTEQENFDDSMQLATLMHNLNSAQMPVITLIQGATYGGAVGLAACSDIVIATSKASFCFSEVRIGLIPAVISPYVIAAIGESQARRYFLTAEAFDVTTAEKLNLVHIISDDLNDAKHQVLNQILNNSPKAIKKAKSPNPRRIELPYRPAAN